MSTILDRPPHKKEDEKEISLKEYLLSGNEKEKKKFPTLYSLTELQKREGKAPQYEENTNPDPFPPKRRKNELLQHISFENIEHHIRNLSPPQPWEDWLDLANKVFICTCKHRSKASLNEPNTSSQSYQKPSCCCKQCDSHSALAKVRAAFLFTCRDWQQSESQMHVKVQTEENRAGVNKTKKTAYEIIQERRFQEIFENLINHSGVPYKKIVGYKKSADRELGWHYEKPNGVWHACFVEGEWRFVDVQWAAVYLRVFESENSSISSNSNGPRSEKKYDCNEFFFLTDPEKLIVSHFPKRVSDFPKHKYPDFQLLPQPLTKDEFEQMPHYFEGSERAMDYGYMVEPINYPKNVIVAGPGPVEIYFRVPEEDSKSKLEFDVRTSPSQNMPNKGLSKSQRGSETNGIRDQSTVRVERLGFTEDCLRITFQPSNAGKYNLVIRIRKGMSDKWARFLRYTVHCPPEVEEEVIVPPKNLSTKFVAETYPLNITRESLASLRSYSKPPKVTYNAVRAILLMLGFYEKRSRKWYRCQPLITAIPEAVRRKILNPIDPRIAARSLELIDASPETENRLKNHNVAAHAFYKWVEHTATHVVEKYKTAATIQTQKQLLRVSEAEDTHWDWEDSQVKEESGCKFLGYCEICRIALYSNDLKAHLHCSLPKKSGRHTARN